MDRLNMLYLSVSTTPAFISVRGSVCTTEGCGGNVVKRPTTTFHKQRASTFGIPYCEVCEARYPGAVHVPIAEKNPPTRQ